MSKVNFFALVVGPPEHGKSSLCAELALARLKAGSFVLVQDQNGEFGRLCAPYPTPGEFLAVVNKAAAEKQAIPRGAALACAGGADELIALGISLGEQWNRGHATTRAPICVVVNESSSFSETGSTYMGKLQDFILNQRRHLGIELVYCLQRPSMLPQPVYDVATDVFLFRQSNTERVRDLERNLGVEKGSLEILLSLRPHKYIHWTQRGFA
jgi:hypothetical protein